MICQLSRRRRFPRALEIRGCAERKSTRLSDLARHHRGVGEHAHGKCHIDPFFDQVDIAVVEDRFDRELGMGCEEEREPRNDVKSAERDARAETQPARKTVTRFARRKFRLLCLLDRALGAPIKSSGPPLSG